MRCFTNTLLADVPSVYLSPDPTFRVSRLHSMSAASEGLTASSSTRISALTGPPAVVRNKCWRATPCLSAVPAVFHRERSGGSDAQDDLGLQFRPRIADQRTKREHAEFPSSDGGTPEPMAAGRGETDTSRPVRVAPTSHRRSPGSRAWCGSRRRASPRPYAVLREGVHDVGHGVTRRWKAGSESFQGLPAAHCAGCQSPIFLGGK